ncbi:FAD-dependent oxidoreductase [Haloarcula salinisoli]|uniref:FAD-dependent oxidoreductase n=1 Tax=Haloarcula salinisoli TaxID=2487746 RepID=A0A8J8CB67_9EURY|nr:FAD-dependent oxidoreductase [Halomicroarcula salinisoli]MBX0305894.1 FAD-dependent oxidoreductase [Halomicroarcula salinisoli]
MDDSLSPPDLPEGRHESVWFPTSDRTDYDPLDGDRSVDTAVVGGGIAGITTAAKLDAAGQTVAILERDRILDGTTGHTTAKVTSLHGLVYDTLIENFGAENARQYAAANQAAVDDIAATVDRRDIDCGFGRAPAYTYAKSDEDRSKVRSEVNAARRLGLPASYVEETELPYEVDSAVRFDEQAYFHPRQYLLELASDVAAGDGAVFEETTVEGVEDGTPCRVETDRGTVRADDVVVASHFPVADDALYFSRLRPKRSYVVAARLDGEPPDGLYYHAGEPYFSVRPHATNDALVLLGGQNHRTGHGDSTEERYRRLEQQVRERFDVASIAYRWATQDYVSVDQVPFVGKAAPQVSNVYVATGFGGWGMTNGTAAGRLLADEILGRPSATRDVFDPNRFKPLASKSELLSHNTETVRHYIEDYLGSQPSLDTVDLDPGDAGVYEVDDDPLAVYRDDDGEIHARSAVCPHKGCLVAWNDGERSWDCPCHGSRFGVDGEVLDTPAVHGLDDVSLQDGPDS